MAETTIRLDTRTFLEGLSFGERTGDDFLESLQEALGEPVAEPAPGSLLGRYRLIREVGRGGAAVVFEAYDVEQDRPVALKVLHLSGCASVGRLDREAAAAARLDHPDIAKVYGMETIEGVPCLAMELLAGESLTDWLRRPPRNVARLCEIVERVARAVQHAHDRGVLHRDLKPNNIIIRPDGRPVLTDFGLARIDDGRAGITPPGCVLGTPGYMPPEQAAGSRRIDGRTDVFGLGTILYEGLGLRWTDAPGIDLVFPRGRALGPLKRIVRGCLQSDPDLRYRRPGEAADDLARWRAGERLRIEGPEISGAWRRTVSAAKAVLSVLLHLVSPARGGLKTDRAEREISAVASPRDPEACFEAARFFLEQSERARFAEGSLPDAVAELRWAGEREAERARRLGAADDRMRYLRGLSALAGGRWSEAVEWIAFFQARRPHDAASSWLLGRAYLLGGDLCAAERFLSLAVELDPEGAGARADLDRLRRSQP